VCDKIKAKGVIVYTIAFQVSSTSTQNMLKNCATTPDNFFPSSDGDALNDAFRVIASELSSLRISK
ncbi:MAG: VWA domain-containing protein, partial [Pseudomonadota bacterium]